MAWTNAINHKTTFGNMKVVLMSCTADAAESNILTGLSKVFQYSISPQSLTSGAPKLFANKNSTGTAAQGYIGASGFTSGDVFFLTVYGV